MTATWLELIHDYKSLQRNAKQLSEYVTRTIYSENKGTTGIRD